MKESGKLKHDFLLYRLRNDLAGNSFLINTKDTSYE